MYIPIQKLEETSAAALYAFFVEDHGWVRFWVDRASGAARLEEPVPGIEGHYARAARHVRQRWARGLFPERTCWAG